MKVFINNQLIFHLFSFVYGFVVACVHNDLVSKWWLASMPAYILIGYFFKDKEQGK